MTLARIYYDAGNYDAAKPLYERAMKIIEYKKGVYTPDTDTIAPPERRVGHRRQLIVPPALLILKLKRLIELVVRPDFSCCQTLVQYAIGQITTENAATGPVALGRFIRIVIDAMLQNPSLIWLPVTDIDFAPIIPRWPRLAGLAEEVDRMTDSPLMLFLKFVFGCGGGRIVLDPETAQPI